VYCTGCDKDYPPVKQVGNVVRAMDDSIFIQYCLEICDFNKDGVISTSEANTVYLMDLSGCPEIRSIKGIEYFVNLESLKAINCKNITSIDLRNNKKIKELTNECFRGCSKLNELLLPNSLEVISGSPFYDCSCLTDITIPDSVITIGNYAFYGSNLTTITIPDSVTMIGDYAFESCYSLINLTIPDSVTSIGYRAFSGCDSLTSVIIGNGITAIKRYTFYYCSNLDSIVIPDSVVEIESDAFYYCDIKSVRIGCGITRIGEAFDGKCMETLYCMSTTPPILFDGGLFYSFYRNGDLLISVPIESVDAYKTADGWKKYANDIVGYNFNTTN
jgi:hypothetical protein